MSSEKPTRRGLHGARVADAGSFPDEQEIYRGMTPGERMEAVLELSRRLCGVSPAQEMDRRVGGHIEPDGARRPRR